MVQTLFYDSLCHAQEVNVHLRSADEAMSLLAPLLSRGWQESAQAQELPVQTALRTFGWVSSPSQTNPAVEPTLKILSQSFPTRLGADANLFEALLPCVLQSEPRARILFSVGPSAEFLCWSFEASLKLRQVKVSISYENASIVDHQLLLTGVADTPVSPQEAPEAPAAPETAEEPEERYEVRIPGKIHDQMVAEHITPEASEIQTHGRNRTAIYLLTPDEIEGLAELLDEWDEPVLANRVRDSLT